MTKKQALSQAQHRARSTGKGIYIYPDRIDKDWALSAVAPTPHDCRRFFQVLPSGEVVKALMEGELCR